jgi:hypothetical protein
MGFQGSGFTQETKARIIMTHIYNQRTVSKIVAMPSNTFPAINMALLCCYPAVGLIAIVGNYPLLPKIAVPTLTIVAPSSMAT